MRKEMEKLAKELTELNKGLYFTENPINHDGRHEGCKYFLCFYGTHTVRGSWKTQAEAIDGIKDLIEYYNELESKCE